MTKIIVTFRNFANAPKNKRFELSKVGLYSRHSVYHWTLNGYARFALFLAETWKQETITPIACACLISTFIGQI